MNTPVTPPLTGTAVDTRCLANARLVLADRVVHGRVDIAGDQIAAIEETSRVPAGAEDLQGDYLIPGLVELHTDNLERHLSPRPNVDWPHDSAILAHDAELAGCGITTVFDAMRVGSILSEGKGGYKKYARAMTDEILSLRTAGALRIRHLIHLRAETCSETLIDELAEFTAADRVGIVSMMDHTPGQRQFRDLSKLRAYVMGKHNLNEDEWQAHVAKLLALREELGETHEAATVSAAARFGAVLASHDDTTAEQVALSAGYGIRLAEFPTTVEAAAACRDAGIAVMMGAPNLIRGGSHSGNVAASDLAEQGLLDIVSSDYVPSALLLSAFRLAAIWDDLPRAIASVTRAPAQATGLQDRGEIAPGLAADLVRVGTTRSTPVARATWVRGVRVA